jgi:capsular exopolysaccharide synthesis family protein
MSNAPDQRPTYHVDPHQEVRRSADLLVENSRGKEFMDLEHRTAKHHLSLPVEVAEVDPETTRIFYYSNPLSASADRFRGLRMSLRELQSIQRLKSLLITSPLPHDGKSTMVLNIATVLAERGRKSVLVVEGDLHHPTLTKALGLNNCTGLADCLANHINPMSVIRRIEPLGWYLLTAGTHFPNPSDLLEAESLPMLMAELASSFDWVLVDSPPVAPLTDTLSLAKSTDGALLVANAGQTPRRLVDEAITLLGRKRIFGFILNRVEGINSYYAGYGSYGGNPDRV